MNADTVNFESFKSKIKNTGKLVITTKKDITSCWW